MHSLEPLLAEHPFFKGLDPAFIELLVGCATNVRSEPDEYLFHEGDPANKFYIVREGHIALELFAPGRGPIVVETFGKNDVLGWSWLIPPYEHHFNIRAIERTRAFALDAECLRNKCDQDPRMGYELLKRFAVLLVERLQAMGLQIMDIYGTPA